jgi:hypothetical protein
MHILRYNSAVFSISSLSALVNYPLHLPTILLSEFSLFLYLLSYFQNVYFQRLFDFYNDIAQLQSILFNIRYNARGFIIFPQLLFGSDYQRTREHSPRYPLYKGETLEIVWMLWRREKFLFLPGIIFRFHGHPTHGIFAIVTDLSRLL